MRMLIQLCLLAVLALPSQAQTVKIGPTFSTELRAAGLGDVVKTWRSDGTIFDVDKLTATQKRTLDGVLKAHDPTKELPAQKREIERLLDAMIAEGLIPSAKRQSVIDRMKAVQ